MWKKIFLVNWALNILAVEFLALRKLRRIIKSDKKRDEKYAPFRRTDLKWFNRPWLYLTCHLSLAKVAFAIGSCIMCGICNVLTTIGRRKNKPITGLRYWLMRFQCWLTARIVIFCASGALYIHSHRPKVCYKKYLGPDWKPDYDIKRCGTVIGNHTSFIDSPMHGLCQLPGFIAKSSVKKIPGVGNVAEANQCIFIDRKSTDGRSNIQEKIIERQKLCEEDPRYDPLLIHPEGGTTNGKYLIMFKRGAFVGCRSIMPKIHKYHSFCQSACTGVIDGLPHYLLGSAIPFSYVEKMELPVFRPNEYFFEHHQKDGEERWETYRRVIRDIMAEVGGFEKSDMHIEQKFEYKQLLYAKKTQQEKQE